MNAPLKQPAVTPPAPHKHAYPDPETHRRRWRRLARAIAAAQESISDAISDDVPIAAVPAARQGTLEILGSGIEAVGFTRADEARIRAADEVFYCVADPATKVWLLRERPDAYDLYVLYDDAKRRYVTYMQMAEAMLHPVRQGRRVVAIFYGHPGIFVLATHRAVKIARREGHRAEMRPAVSALDTLCADLGVDPSQPGMQMYEATDMLIRTRRPDPGLHLVLWQVGLIGELGYRRQGYLNSNFSVLLDYLEALYGPDHPVINYVGSRYPGIDPVIERHSIASLRDPAAQNWVTGISTFYLPPLRAQPSDPAMLERLGLIKPGQPVREAPDPLRVIDRYGPRERRAFTDFVSFDVPQSYQWQADTPAARFILDLCEDADLRERYRADPATALAAWDGSAGGGGLSARERELLARREPGAIQIAAKGLRSASEPHNRRLLESLLKRKSLTAGLLAAVKRAPAGGVLAAAQAWGEHAGLAVDWHAMAGDLQHLLRRSLAPWSGLYLVAARELSLSIHGHPGGAVTRVDLNGRRLLGVRFEQGVLAWSADAGNSCSGYLQPDVTPRGARRLVGLLWDAGQTPGSGDKVVALEHLPRPRLPVSALVGEYAVEAAGQPPLRVAIVPTAQACVRVTVNGLPTDAMPLAGRDSFTIGACSVPFKARVVSARLPAWFEGAYRLCVQHGALAEIVPMEIGADSIAIGGQQVSATFEGDMLRWHDGPPALPEGRISLMLDPVTLRPLLHGSAGAAGTANSARLALRGMAVIDDAAASAMAQAGGARLRLPGWAWRHLLALMAASSTKGGLFLWHGYERASTNMARIGAVIARLHRDGMA